MHFVQVSNDFNLLTLDENAEPVRRQRSYQEALEALHPGARMTILIPRSPRKAGPRVMGGLTIVPCPGRLLSWVRTCRALERLHRSNPISVITTQRVFGEAWGAVLFRLIRKVPIVGQIHFDLFSPKALADCFGRGPRGRIRWKVMTRTLRRFNRLRVVGKRTGEEIVRRGLHRQEAIYVLPVPVPMLSSVVAQSHLDEPRVLFVGRLVFAKNMDLWLRVAREVSEAVPAAQFDIVGDGALREELESRAQSLGISTKVTFHGDIPYEKLSPFYSRARVFLLTSHFEGYGRVLVEAFGHGVPCVAVRNAGVEDIIEHERTGFLHEPEDVSGLALSVIRLLTDASLAQSFGREGNASVRKTFDPEQLIRRNMAELLAAARPDSPVRTPRYRSWRRLFALAGAKSSLLRSLQYEVLQNIKLKGRQLDIGGGARSNYLPRLQIDGVIEGVNIDEKMRPAFVHDLGQPLPLADGSYDGFISLNTFEHLCDDKFALGEAFRVIKPGGTFHILVPFCYRLHAAPWDFNRRTPYWWIKTLTGLGLAPEHFEIEPLVWSRLASGAALIENPGSRWSRGLRKLAMIPAMLADALPWRKPDARGRLVDTPKNRIPTDFAVGFYIHGSKPV